MEIAKQRITAFLISLFLAYCIVLSAHAETSNIVFGIRNEFPMSDTDQTSKDYYVGLGTSQGLRVGTTLDVYRSQATADELNQKHLENISFKFARLKVIHAEGNMAVARLIEIQSPSKGAPIALIPSVMVGDRVEVSRSK